MSFQEIIQDCSEYLSQTGNTIGTVIQKIKSPLVSVFLGKQAQHYQENVIRRYRLRWGTDADKVQAHSSDKGTPEEVLGEIYAALERSDYYDLTQVYLVYYWDITDQNFTQIFETLQLPIKITDVYQIQPIYFIFFQRDNANSLIKDRVECVAQWAEKTQKHIVLIGNVTRRGIISSKRIVENYLLAADVAVLSNSCSRGRVSCQMGYHLASGSLFSLGYYSIGKKVEEITRASFIKIIDCYQSMADSLGNVGIRSTVFSEWNGYNGLFDMVFREKIERAIICNNGDLFLNIPCTDDIEKFFGNTTPQRGLLRKILHGNNNSLAGAISSEQGRKAVASLGKEWKTITDLYYREPVYTWLESQGGWEQVRDLLVRTVAGKIGTDQLFQGELEQEAKMLLSKTPEDIRAELQGNIQADSPTEWLHEYAILELKKEIYVQLYRILGECLQNLTEAAGIFGDVMNTAKAHLESEPIEDSIRTAYRMLIERVSNQFASTIRENIHPCTSEEQFLQQVADVFRIIAAATPEYHYSFAEETAWRANQVGYHQNAVASVVTKGFYTDFYDTARITIYTQPDQDYKYTLASSSNSLLDSIPQTIIGEVFYVPSGDQIERICLFPVEMNNVQW